jgi:hypothetical protein
MFLTFIMFPGLVICQDLEDREKTSPLSSRLSLSYLVGGQLFNDHFLYNPGISALFTESYRITGSFEAGLGSGYVSLIDERFVPVYLEAFGYKKKGKNSPVIRFQAGFSSAWFGNEHFSAEYKLKGGLYFTAGMGRKIDLKNRYSILFLWSYYHQSGSINYQVFNGDNYSTPVNYDMIQLSFGIMRD